MKTLSILIPTITGREKQFSKLFKALEKQRKAYSNPDEIEIISLKDNKEMSIGAKRNKLYEMAQGKYSIQVDDDDSLSPNYIETIMKHIAEEPDCIGYLEHCVMDGVKKLACHSNRFKDWAENVDGFDYVRTIFYKDVIKTEIARKVKFNDMRYAEDHNWSRKLKASGLLKKEVFINEPMYYYSHNSRSKEEHKSNFGIK